MGFWRLQEGNKIIQPSWKTINFFKKKENEIIQEQGITESNLKFHYQSFLLNIFQMAKPKLK